METKLNFFVELPVYSDESLAGVCVEILKEVAIHAESTFQACILGLCSCSEWPVLP